MKGIVTHFGKYAFLSYCELEDKIDTTLIYV